MSRYSFSVPGAMVAYPYAYRKLTKTYDDSTKEGQKKVKEQRKVEIKHAKEFADMERKSREAKANPAPATVSLSAKQKRDRDIARIKTWDPKEAVSAYKDMRGREKDFKAEGDPKGDYWAKKANLLKAHPAVAAERKAQADKLRETRASRSIVTQQSNGGTTRAKRGSQVADVNKLIAAHTKAIQWPADSGKKAEEIAAKAYEKHGISLSVHAAPGIRETIGLTKTGKDLQPVLARATRMATSGGGGKGKGRGNWGHKGRPGARGGSA